MPAAETSALRWRTAQAMALLCLARLAVQALPFAWWRATLGRIVPDQRGPAPVLFSRDFLTETGAHCLSSRYRARRLAAHIDRGAARLPFACKCLPRAMALCWLLRGAGIGYVFKIAARPAAARIGMAAADDDRLHAWVEAGGGIVIGALPGPWLVMLAMRG